MERPCLKKLPIITLQRTFKRSFWCFKRYQIFLKCQLKEHTRTYMCTQVCSISDWRSRMPGRSSFVLKKKCFMLCLQGAHFVQLCCQRNIPLLFLQNITGEEKFFCSYVQNCPVLCGSCVNVERIHEYGVVWDHRMSSE